jgi:hypothetical protein
MDMRQDLVALGQQQAEGEGLRRAQVPLDHRDLRRRRHRGDVAPFELVGRHHEVPFAVIGVGRGGGACNGQRRGGQGGTARLEHYGKDCHRDSPFVVLPRIFGGRRDRRLERPGRFPGDRAETSGCRAGEPEE